MAIFLFWYSLDLKKINDFNFNKNNYLIFKFFVLI